MIENNYLPVADFYAGKSVFITGGTGFLGKVIIEKLLYSTKIHKIYMLMRETEGNNAAQRLSNMFESPLFQRLLKERPEDLNKIVPIVGDVVCPNLGISYSDEEHLIENVSVVIHSAATVKFNETIKTALEVNLEGTQKVLNLCKRIKRTEAFIYVSTAYANTKKDIIEEDVNRHVMQLGDVYKFIQQYGDDNEKSAEFLSSNCQPNAYTFSKSLTELYVARHHDDVPTVIVRPSIVSPTAEEPLEGWSENWFGATDILYSNSKGWNRIIHGDSKFVLDLIPVDYVSNFIIISGARCNKSKEAQIYNCCSSSTNPIAWKELTNLFRDECVRDGSNDLPYPTMMYSKSRFTVTLVTFTLQIIPAFTADLWLRFTGKGPKYLKLQKRAINLRNSLDYFMINSWVIQSKKSSNLIASLSPNDQKLFSCNPSNINWKKYIPIYYQGIRRYLLKK